MDFLVDRFFEEGSGGVAEIGVEPAEAKTVVVEEAVDVVVAGDFIDESVGAVLNFLGMRIHHEGDLVLVLGGRDVGGL